jgi:hypothetical protein
MEKWLKRQNTKFVKATNEGKIAPFNSSTSRNFSTRRGYFLHPQEL